MSKYKNNQWGATLITVLVLLVLITIVGLYAIRQSLFSLKMATNAQVQTLLMQTSDVALDHMEKNFNSNEATNFAGTPIGQVLLDGNEGLELQFCFKPTEISTGTTLKNSLFFDLREFRIIERASASAATGVSAALSGNINAVCDPTKMFSISRKAIVTQVAVVNPDDPAVEADRFEFTNKKGDPKDDSVDSKRVRVTVTSFSPALASASVANINTCLSGRMMDDLLLRNREDTDSGQVKVETLHKCLIELGVPINTQSAEYFVQLLENRS